MQFLLYEKVVCAEEKPRIELLGVKLVRKAGKFSGLTGFALLGESS